MASKRGCAHRALRWVATASWLLGAGAHGQPPEPADRLELTLEAIDSILAASKVQRSELNAPRPDRLGESLCETSSRLEPGAENRDFLCTHSTLIGRWALKDRREESLRATLEARRFSSTEQARAAKVTALERYGGGLVSTHEGAISWCFVDVFWSDELFFSLAYGCNISLGHVPWLKAVRSELARAAKPFDRTEIIGVAGSHSGWSWLLGPQGEKAVPLRDDVRFKHFVRVTNVVAPDVLWLRGRPEGGRRGPKIDKLPADASCVPLVFVPPPLKPDAGQASGWVLVRFNGRQGWVDRSFLAEQPIGECTAEAPN
jgi:hypothetical protein